MKITQKQLRSIVESVISEAPKSKIIKRKWNVYCNAIGEFWWDDGGSHWGPFTLEETKRWFAEQLDEQLSEAKA